MNPAYPDSRAATPITQRFEFHSQRLCAFLVLLLAPLTFFGKTPPEVICSLTAILFLSSSALRRDFTWAGNRWVQAALLLWLYLVVRATFSDDPLLALSRAFYWLRYPVFAAALAFWIIRDHDYSRKLFISLCIGVGMLTADTLLQFFTGSDILGREPASLDRLTGPFKKPRIGYTIAWLALPVILCCFRPFPGKVLWRVLALLSMAAICFTILVSGERTPTLLLGLGLLLALIFQRSARKVLLWLLPVGLLALGALFYVYPHVYERQVVATQQVLTNYMRSPYGLLVRDSWDMVKEAPVFGIGINHYRVETEQGSDAREQGHSHPHNFYLELAVESGLIGLGLFLVFVGIVLKDLWQRRRIWRRDLLLAGLAIAVAVRFWPIISNPSFYANWNVIPLWFLLGWYFALMPQRSLRQE